MNAETLQFLDTPEAQGEFFQVQPDGSRQMKFFVEGVKCSHCLWNVENLKNELPYVHNIQLNLGQKVATVTVAPEGSLAQVAYQLQKMGYEPHPLPLQDGEEAKNRQVNKKYLFKIAVAAFCTGNIMLFSVSLYAGLHSSLKPVFEWLCFFLFLPVLFYSATPFYQTSLQALKQKKPSIDWPISLALVIGFLLSTYHLILQKGDFYFDSLAMLVFLLLSSRYFLLRVQQHHLSPSYIKSFLQARVAQVWDQGQWKKRASHRLQKGQRIRVLKGEKLPADGQLLSEQALLNTALLTGEATPRKRLKGDLCYAGTELITPEAEFLVTAAGSESRLGKLLQQVEKELLKKTPFISLTDRLAQVFTLSALALGGLFFLIYSWVDMEEAIRRSLALVILACPCALALATPLSQSLSLLKALKEGLLIKNATALEKLLQVKNIVFDKTGTLTQGHFQVLSWLPRPPSEQEKQVIYQLEKKASHPIAVFFKNLFAQPHTLPVRDFKEIPGQGVCGYVGDDFYELKSAPLPSEPLPERLQTSSCVGLYKNSKLVLRAFLGDQIHPSAPQLISSLSDYSLYLLSGDQKKAVESLARHVGIPPQNALAELSPEDKKNWIQQHPQSLMVGEGANDLLAFSGSYLSLAVKGSVEASLRVADIYLMDSDLLKIQKALKIAQNNMNTIKRNLVFSFVYNSIGGTAALLGFVSPLIAAVLMPLSSLTVILSSLYSIQRRSL
ncbi:MAG: heavy metal translocating P-type ATPase [Bdellovibrio sp.]|nr:MAG: heavy metal translocating P-type ATPase [Bdellovibrio sp.]